MNLYVFFSPCSMFVTLMFVSFQHKTLCHEGTGDISYCLLFLSISSLRGHVQCHPVQLSLSGDLCLSGSPHPRAPGVRGAASQGPATVATGDQCRGHDCRRPTWKHHLPCQTLPVQSGAPVPARARSGQVPEAEVPLVPRPGGAVIRGCREFNG